MHFHGHTTPNLLFCDLRHIQYKVPGGHRVSQRGGPTIIDMNHICNWSATGDGAVLVVMSNRQKYILDMEFTKFTKIYCDTYDITNPLEDE